MPIKHEDWKKMIPGKSQIIDVDDNVWTVVKKVPHDIREVFTLFRQGDDKPADYFFMGTYVDEDNRGDNFGPAVRYWGDDKIGVHRILTDPMSYIETLQLERPWRDDRPEKEQSELPTKDSLISTAIDVIKTSNGCTFTVEHFIAKFGKGFRYVMKGTGSDNINTKGSMYISIDSKSVNDYDPTIPDAYSRALSDGNIMFKKFVRQIIKKSADKKEQA